MRRLYNNKSFIAFLLATIITAGLFTGCTSSAHRDKTGGQFFQPEANDGAAFTDDIDIAISDIVSARSRIVFDINDDSYDGVYKNSQYFDTNQYFFRLTKDNGTKYGITFTGTLDENYQQTVFCSAEGCEHTDNSCPAHIDMIGGYFTLKGKLYFYSPCAYEYTTDDFDGQGARIRILEIAPDGKNLFAELPGYTQTSGTVITDGTYLYLTAQQEQDKEIYIVQVDMKTGGVKVLHRISSQMGLTDYRICDITADGKQLVFIARVADKMEDSKIAVYSVKDGRFAVVQPLPAEKYKPATEDGLTFNYIQSGNYLYQADMDKGRIIRQRIGTEETEVIVENLREDTDYPHHITFGYPYGNKMVLTCFADSKHRLSTAWYYVLNTDTGTVTPLKIKAYNNMGITSLARIFAATQDYFVVATDISGYSALANEMALIKKVDFYANNPRFIPIGIIGV